MRLVRALDVAAEPWRNGGGRTRVLLTLAAQDDGHGDGGGTDGGGLAADDWRLRLTLADIAADGPFSAFAGVRRWIAVVEGDGLRLGFADGETVLRPGDPPFAFDGAAAPRCRPIGGPTRVLNLMLRGGGGCGDCGDGTLHRAHAGVAWPGARGVGRAEDAGEAEEGRRSSGRPGAAPTVGGGPGIGGAGDVDSVAALPPPCAGATGTAIGPVTASPNSAGCADSAPSAETPLATATPAVGATHGLFTTVAGQLRCGAGAARAVPALTLCWPLGAGPHRFEPDAPAAAGAACGWWIVHAPEGAR